MRKIGAAIAAAIVLATAGACSSHQIDREAWAKDLAGEGVTVKDWDKYEKAILGLCDDDESQLQMDLAVFKDGGTSMKRLELDFRNACPDRLEDFNAAVAKMTQTSAEFDIICRTPKSERTDQQQTLAEAYGC